MIRFPTTKPASQEVGFCCLYTYPLTLFNLKFGQGVASEHPSQFEAIIAHDIIYNILIMSIM